MLSVIQVLSCANTCVEVAVTLKRDTMSALLYNSLLNHNNRQELETG